MNTKKSSLKELIILPILMVITIVIMLYVGYRAYRFVKADFAAQTERLNNMPLPVTGY